VKRESYANKEKEIFFNKHVFPERFNMFADSGFSQKDIGLC